MDDHPAYSSPAYGRLFREAVRESVADYAQQERLMRPGYWQIRLVKRGPILPARVWLCDHEPDNPENKLDTGPYFVAEIGGKPGDPLDVFTASYRKEITEEAQHQFELDDLLYARKWSPREAKAQHPYRRVKLTEIAPVYKRKEP
jgi:hypothetical protein